MPSRLLFFCQFFPCEREISVSAVRIRIDPRPVAVALEKHPQAAPLIAALPIGFGYYNQIRSGG